MTAITLIILFAAGSYGCGLLLLPLFRIKVHGWIEEITLSAAVGLGALGLVVMAMTMAHLLSTAALVALTVIYLLAGATGIALRRRPERLGGGQKTEPVLGWEIGVAIYIGIFFVFAIVFCFVPSWRPDEILYHLAIPKVFLKNGGVKFVPTVWQANYPLFTEMYFLIGMALQGQTLAKLFSCLIGVLFLGSAWCLSRRIYGREAGALTVLILVAIPMVFNQSSTTFVDVAVTAWLVLASYVCAVYREEPSYRTALLAGLFAGCAAGSKLPAMLGMFFVAAVILVLGLMKKGKAFSLLAMCLTGGVALLVAAPWYVKNLVLTGNPLWPFGQSIFGGDYLTREVVATLHTEISLFGEPKTLKAFLKFPYLILHDFTPLLVLGLAMLPFVRERRKETIFLICTAAFFTGIYFWINSQLRFILIVAVLLAVSGGAVFSLKSMRKNITYAVILIAAIFAFYRAERHPAKRLIEEGRGITDREGILGERVSEYRDYVKMNRTLPESALVMLHAEAPYYLDRDWFRAYLGEQAYVDFTRLDSEEALIARIREVGVTHVYVNKRSSHVSRLFPGVKVQKRIYEMGKSGKLSIVFETNYSALFSVSRQAPGAGRQEE